MINVAINGFGRIGRNILRALYERPDIYAQLRVVEVLVEEDDVRRRGEAGDEGHEALDLLDALAARGANARDLLLVRVVRHRGRHRVRRPGLHHEEH